MKSNLTPSLTFLQKSHRQNPTTQNPTEKVQRFSMAMGLAVFVAILFGRCAVNQTCSADVIEYHPPGGSVSITPSDSAGFEVELNGDALIDFRLIWGNFTGGPSFFEIDGFPYSDNNIVDATQDSDPYLVDIILPGELVGPTFDGSSGNALFVPFVNTRAFVGVQFDIPDGSDIGQHFGYLDVGVNAANNVLTIYGGAYEDTPNTPLTTASVPEPNTLALLAIGALAATAKRRRRS